MPPKKIRSRRSSNGRHRRVATREGSKGYLVVGNYLVEPCAAGNEEAWNTLVANSPPEDYAVVSAAATAAELASTTRRRR